MTRHDALEDPPHNRDHAALLPRVTRCSNHVHARGGRGARQRPLRNTTRPHLPRCHLHQCQWAHARRPQELTSSPRGRFVAIGWEIVKKTLGLRARLPLLPPAWWVVVQLPAWRRPWAPPPSRAASPPAWRPTVGDAVSGGIGAGLAPTADAAVGGGGDANVLPPVDGAVVVGLAPPAGSAVDSRNAATGLAPPAAAAAGGGNDADVLLPVDCAVTAGLALSVDVRIESSSLEKIKLVSNRR